MGHVEHSGAVLKKNNELRKKRSLFKDNNFINYGSSFSITADLICLVVAFISFQSSDLCGALWGQKHWTLQSAVQACSFSV